MAWAQQLEADKAALKKNQQRAVSVISGMQGTTYEEKLKELGVTTLEERRHKADMVQSFKILQGCDNVNSETWLQKVETSVRMTRSAADPLNLKPQAPRLKIRRTFLLKQSC
jgi:ribonucleases P/MRP protein subunit RPP40